MMTIHTFELSLTITNETARSYRDAFYTTALGSHTRCYSDKAGWLKFSKWSEQGLLFALKKNDHTPGSTLKLRVNPSRLLGNPDAAALFLPDETSMRDLCDSLDEILRQLPFGPSIYAFKLNRLDLCRNILAEDQEYIEEYIRLLHKGASSSGWTVQSFGDQRDQHSFRRINENCQFTAYDKLYQIQDQHLSTSWSQSPAILRMEVSLFSSGIAYQAEQLSIPKGHIWPALMMDLSAHGTAIMWKTAGRLVPDSPYYTLREAKGVIRQCQQCSVSKRQNLMDFLEKINRYDQLDRKQIQSFPNGKKRLKQLKKIGINPVTIEARAGIPYLPSVPQLITLGIIPRSGDCASA